MQIVIRCEPKIAQCRRGFAAWCRVWVARPGQEPTISELAWPLAIRIVPQLCARYGIEEQAGMFGGSPMIGA